MNILNERRKDPRIANNIPLKISTPDGDFVTKTGNISRSGAYCSVEKYIEPMTKMRIHLLLPLRKGNKITNKKISCSGVVVRTEEIMRGESYNVAIFFNDISKKDSENITEYINSHLVREGAC